MHVLSFVELLRGFLLSPRFVGGKAVIQEALYRRALSDVLLSTDRNESVKEIVRASIGNHQYHHPLLPFSSCHRFKKFHHS
jgi:hypothetical protein